MRLSVFFRRMRQGVEIPFERGALRRKSSAYEFICLPLIARQGAFMIVPSLQVGSGYINGVASVRSSYRFHKIIAVIMLASNEIACKPDGKAWVPRRLTGPSGP